MAEGQRSAASMNFAQVESGGSAADSKGRGNISWEAQRATAGPKAIAQYAAANPAINVEATHRNVDMVNDGAGGFRPTRAIAEVVGYGDDRVSRLSTAPKAGNRVALTTVGQLPWAYCEPDGTEYQAVDGNGDPKFDEGGKPVMLPRYKIREDRREEAMRYFDDWVMYQASILPGGQASMHGYSINLDESRPHIQLLSDPFEAAPTKKNPDALKSGYSRAFGRHPKDAMVPKLDKSGQPVVSDDGTQQMVKDNASTKMVRYQANLRTYMVERGYEVDPERDEQRHDRHLSLPDYKDLEQQKNDAQSREQDATALMGAAITRDAFDEAEAARDVEQLIESVEEHRVDELGEVFALQQEYSTKITEFETEVVPRLRAKAKREGLEAAQPEIEQAKVAAVVQGQEEFDQSVRPVLERRVREQAEAALDTERESLRAQQERARRAEALADDRADTAQARIAEYDERLSAVETREQRAQQVIDEDRAVAVDRLVGEMGVHRSKVMRTTKLGDGRTIEALVTEAADKSFQDEQELRRSGFNIPGSGDPHETRAERDAAVARNRASTRSRVAQVNRKQQAEQSRDDHLGMG